MIKKNSGRLRSERPRSPRFLFLILTQRRHWYGNVQCRRPGAYPALTGIGREGTNRAVALASPAPEHVAEHPRGCPRSRRRNRLHKIDSHFLIGTGIAVAVRYHVISHNPHAACKLRRRQRRHASGEPADMLLPESLGSGNRGLL